MTGGRLATTWPRAFFFIGGDFCLLPTRRINLARSTCLGEKGGFGSCLYPRINPPISRRRAMHKRGHRLGAHSREKETERRDRSRPRHATETRTETRTRFHVRGPAARFCPPPKKRREARDEPSVAFSSRARASAAASGKNSRHCEYYRRTRDSLARSLVRSW